MRALGILIGRLLFYVSGRFGNNPAPVREFSGPFLVEAQKEKERRRAARRIFAREQQEDRFSSPEKLSLQQGQYVLRSCVGLRQRRHARLQQDLRLGQVGRFGRQVGVANPRLGRSLVG